MAPFDVLGVLTDHVPFIPFERGHSPVRFHVNWWAAPSPGQVFRPAAAPREVRQAAATLLAQGLGDGQPTSVASGQQDFYTLAGN